jgi:hypothetical protein
VVTINSTPREPAPCQDLPVPTPYAPFPDDWSRALAVVAHQAGEHLPGATLAATFELIPT